MLTAVAASGKGGEVDAEAERLLAELRGPGRGVAGCASLEEPFRLPEVVRDML